MGRLNIIPRLSDEKESYLLAGMQSPPTIVHRRTKWSFFEVQADTIQDNRFIHGFLVKYRSSESDEVVSEEAHELVHETVVNRVAAKARFFIHLPSLIIAFQEGRIITEEVFVERFVALLREGHGGFFIVPEIQLIQEEFAVFEAIREFDVISKVSIYLHPSNPDSTPDWDDFDDHLTAVGAASYREEYIAAPNTQGLRIADDPDIKAKITMAQDGYGKASVTGIVDGRPRTVTTLDSPVTARAPRDPDVEPSVVVEALRAAFNAVLRRFGKSL